MSENKRLLWADALRGLLILSVALGHSLQFGDYNNRLSWNIIYSFHMAAFFVVSGYVSYKEDYKLSSLKWKAKQLLLPFIAWTILEGASLTRLYNVILKPDRSFWFLFVMFFIIALFIVIHNITPKKEWKLIAYKDISLLVAIISLILLMVATEFRYFGFQFFALYFGFYVYGYWIRKYSVNFNIAWIIIFGVIWIVLALFWRMHDVPAPLTNINFIPDSIIIYSYRYITAFAGSLFFMSFAMKYLNKENVMSRILVYLGNNSLGIYVIHLYLGHKFVSNFFENLLGENTSITFIVCDFITRIVISIILINLIQRIPVVRLFLLGKK